MLEFKPARPSPWIPYRVRHFLRLERDPHAQVIVHWQYSTEPKVSHAYEAPQIAFGGWLVSRVKNVPGRGNWMIQYLRSDEQAFNATYKQICENVRVR
jgi:hypothetical protein